MHVLFCSTVFFIGLPCDSTRTIKGLVKVLCLIPSCIAKLVTSTVLKFCKSRACQWLVRVSKFPMATLESKTIWLCFRPKFFAFAFKHSTFRSWETKQPSSPVLTWRLGQNSPLDLQFASRTRPDETFGTKKSAG